MVDPLSYFSFQPILHAWCNKGCGMCYPVYGMVHIKEPLLLFGKSSPCGGSGFPLSLSKLSFTIWSMPYNRKQNVLSALLNKTSASFLPSEVSVITLHLSTLACLLWLVYFGLSTLAWCSSWDNDAISLPSSLLTSDIFTELSVITISRNV